MKVKDLMQKDVVFVSPKTSLSKVAKLIFGRGINGVPVCQGKKLVGIITEQDILSKLLPSMQDYVEDYVHARDFEGMEEKSKEVLSETAEKIMAKNPTAISPDVPLLQAQSLMFIHNVGRLPVVDSDGNLLGIISKGDIFRGIIGEEISAEEEEGFYDSQAFHYDLLIDWEKRLSAEIPDLVNLFKKEKIEKIVDIGSSTGEHVIALGKIGFDVCGLDASSFMQGISEQKKQKLSKKIADNISFYSHGGEYKTLLQNIKSKFDAALFLGNALPYVIITEPQILKKVSGVLAKKSLLIFQIANFEKILRIKNGFRDFTKRKTVSAFEKEHAFLRFYSEGTGKKLTSIYAVFDLTEGKWAFKGLSTGEVLDIRAGDVINAIKKLGFQDISLYGGSFYGPLFEEPFNPLQSDWLNIVAKRT